MIKNKIVLVIGLSLLFSSCAVIKKFKSEDLNLENTLRESTVVVKDTVVNFMWQDVFVDPTLQALITEGIVNNSDLVIAAENVVQAQEYIIQSKWAYAPTLGANASVGYNYTTALSAESLLIGGTLGWEPDIWGKITANKRAVESGMLKDVAAVRSIQSEVVSNIASMYYQLLALDEQLKITKEFLEISYSTLNAITVMRDNGSTTSAAVEQTLAQCYSAEASVPEIEQAIYSLESSLSILVGRNAGEIGRSVPKEALTHAFIDNGFPFSMVSNRPDVKVAEHSLVQLFNIKESSKAAMYPSFRLGVDIGTSGSFSSPFNFVANFLGGLTAPIFSGRSLRTQYNVNTSRERQAVEQFENTLRTAGAEVSNALYSYNKLTEQVDFRSKEVAANSKAVGYTQQLLFNGKVTYLEVLSAQSNFLTSSLSYVKDKLKKETTFIQLYKSLGGGW